MEKIKDILIAAKAKGLSIESCRKIIVASEGAGHPLQHVARHEDGSLRGIKSRYFKRGPGKFVDGQLKENKGGKYHSQFKNLEQATTYLKTVLESKAGVNALELLSATDWAIHLRYGVASGGEYYERSLQLLSTVRTNDNFVMFLDRAIHSVELRLHHKDGDGLHLQSIYPSSDVFPPGVGEVRVRPDDEDDPSPHFYCVLP
jgi:hypothetical protein